MKENSSTVLGQIDLRRSRQINLFIGWTALLFLQPGVLMEQSFRIQTLADAP